jgi:hypothetical protein
MACLTSEFGSRGGGPTTLNRVEEDYQGMVNLPSTNLMVEGGEFQLLDLREYLQGPGH